VCTPNCTFPVGAVPSATPLTAFQAQGALVSAGQRSGLFPAELTVTTRRAGQGSEAVLTDSAGSAVRACALTKTDTAAAG
jgi:hypothetical protein